MSNLYICSYNCRGLNNTKKRLDIFNILKDKKFDIVCIQETHFTKELEKSIYSEWNGECFYSNGKSNARGVAILIRNALNVKVNNVLKDDNGNFLLLELVFNGMCFLLANIYAPNTDCPEFFNMIFNKIDTLDNIDRYVICGDFNLVLKPDLDYKNYKTINHNVKARNRLLNIITDRDLLDAYRELHGETRTYTWRRLTPFQQGRLDLFLVTSNMINVVRKCDTDICYKSDHSIIVLELCFSEAKHGKGLWKFNNSHLLQMDYLETI